VGSTIGQLPMGKRNVGHDQSQQWQHRAGLFKRKMGSCRGHEPDLFRGSTHGKFDRRIPLGSFDNNQKLEVRIAHLSKLLLGTGQISVLNDALHGILRLGAIFYHVSIRKTYTGLRRI
jgi:hypothetical protein